MRVVEIFLPLTYGDGTAVPAEIFDLLNQELTEKFGGVTAYTRSPAQGLWQDGDRQEEDVITIVEVMTDKLEKAWWADFRERRERLMRQELILIRSSHAARL